VRGRPELAVPELLPEVPEEPLELAVPDDPPPPVQVPLWHCPPAVVQSTQAAPRRPQAALLVPGEQPNFGSQQPAHAVEQLAASSPALPVSSLDGASSTSFPPLPAVGPPLLLVPEPLPDDEGPPPPASRGAVVAGPPASSSPAIEPETRLGPSAHAAPKIRSRPPLAIQMRRARVGVLPFMETSLSLFDGSSRPDDEAIPVIRLGGEKSARQSGAAYSVLRRSSA
jgi:hypothetical protein